MLVCNGRTAEDRRNRFSELAQEFGRRGQNRSSLRSHQIMMAQRFVAGIVLRGLRALCIVGLRFGLCRGREQASEVCISSWSRQFVPVWRVGVSGLGLLRWSRTFGSQYCFPKLAARLTEQE